MWLRQKTIYEGSFWSASSRLAGNEDSHCEILCQLLKRLTFNNTGELISTLVSSSPFYDLAMFGPQSAPVLHPHGPTWPAQPSAPLLKNLGRTLMRGNGLWQNVQQRKNPLHMLHWREEDRLDQLFGSDEDNLARAARFIKENTKTDIVDISMGCPVQQIVKNEAGALWLRTADKISIINRD